MFSSASSRRSRATALTAASAYLKTSHIDASRHAGSVDCPLDHVKQNADPLMAVGRQNLMRPTDTHDCKPPSTGLLTTRWLGIRCTGERPSGESSDNDRCGRIAL